MPEKYSRPPEASEYDAFYQGYVGHVPAGDIIQLLENQLGETMRLLGTLSEEQAGARYAPDKWSVKQIVGHMIEAERVFVYRALAFSRNDPTPLPGYDQDAYVAAANYDQQSWRELLNELRAVRRATVCFFRSLSDAMMERTGTANNVSFSVRALAYIVLGHELHHIGVLKERYGLG